MSNLRIKNKKLKRELENLKKQTVPHKIVYDRREIVTLGCKHEYDDTLYGYIPEDVIFREAINDLSDELKPYHLPIRLFITAVLFLIIFVIGRVKKLFLGLRQ